MRILVLGQTPPPFGGQAMMIQRMLEGDYGPEVRLHHVRMAFSRSMSEMGRFRARKVLELFRVLLATIVGRVRLGTDVLYYSPSGLRWLPLLRDIVVLASVRWLFRRTILHFHAGGVGSCYRDLPKIARALFRMAFWNHDVGIRVSPFAHDDPTELRCKQAYVVPNGIEDLAEERGGRPAVRNEISAESGMPATVHVVFCGVLSEEKGIMVLLEAIATLVERGQRVALDVVGEFESELFEERIRDFLQRKRLAHVAKLLGVLTGADKVRVFQDADIACVPTFAKTETSSLVALEAMCLGLPIVATRWGGIPALVEDGVTGFLVPVRDPEALAERIELLVRDGKLRRTLGENGRSRFLEHFSLQAHRAGLREVFLTCSN